MRTAITRLRDRFTRRTATITVLAAVVLALAGAGAATAAATSRTGTTLTRAVITTQDTAVLYTTAAPTYTTVGSLFIYATAAQIIDVTFTAESACAGTVGWCTVRILVDGVEAAPVAGSDFSFNEAETATSWESHTVERVRTVTVSGSHAVVVQTATVAGAVSHRLDDWTLRALAYAR